MPFGKSFTEFEDDPFFGFQRDRFGSFDDFFSTDPIRRISGGRALDAPRDGGAAGPSQGTVARQGRQSGLFGCDPLSYTQDLFSGFGRAFRSMHEEIGGLQDDPNAHTYTHSSVMSYSQGDDGKPRYYEATSSNTQAPGGVRETRKTVRDSERDLAKMAVGRHIGERSHVMEQSENTRTKEREEKQNFMGMQQNELETFDREWKDKAKSLFRPAEGRRGGYALGRGAEGGAIEAPKGKENKK